MLNRTETIWMDGQFIPWDEAKVHVLCHALHYGSGVFEGIRFYKTDKGPAIFRLKEHVERLFYSAAGLGMKMKYSQEEVSAAIMEVVRSNKLEEGYIRPIVFYGFGKMGLNPIDNPIHLAIACWPWGAYLPYEMVNIKTSKYIRIHPDSTIVDAKICGHYVNSILATLELIGTPYHEALFLDSNGFVCEGVGENFFIVKSGVIYTPNLGTILSGITRDTAIKIAHQAGYQVVETNITLDQAYAADEAFFTGTAAEITPIRSIDDKIIGDGKVGKVSAEIKDAYLNLVRGKGQKFLEYLTVL